jgi:hypothetical protein
MNVSKMVLGQFGVSEYGSIGPNPHYSITYSITPLLHHVRG